MDTGDEKRASCGDGMRHSGEGLQMRKGSCRSWVTRGRRDIHGFLSGYMDDDDDREHKGIG